MEKGYNSDIRILGDLYHIQTEDWGPDSPIMVTRIFKNGAVLKTFKTSYAELIKSLTTTESRAKIREALKFQHRKILDLLQGGQIFYEKHKINM